MKDFVIVEIPQATRWRKALITLGATLTITGLTVGYVWSEGQLGVQTLSVLPFFLLGMIQSYRYWRTSHVTQLTPEAERRKREEEESKRRKQEEFEDKWYFRYPMAGLCLWGAWYFLNEKQDKFWLAAFAVLGAVIFARELSVFLLLIGIGYLLFQGIASLPVSVAVIIGAIIIASALKK